MKKIQKRIRLKNFDYKGTYRYFVTICCDKKAELFKCNNVVELCINLLKKVADKEGFRVWVYCFMPNHLHLLVEGIDDNSDFRRFISVFKQMTSFQFIKATLKGCATKEATLKGRTTKLWQENYYEHILRKEESTFDVVKYILNNPVRKRMIKSYEEYPYSGSFELDIKDSILL